MVEIWPQLLALVLLLAAFLFLILRLRPDTSIWTRKTHPAERMYARLERSPIILILCALIAVLFMIVLVDGVYRFARHVTQPEESPSQVDDVKAMMAQLGSELEEFQRARGVYPENLEILDEATESWVLPALDPYRDPPGRVDYRTDGESWWLLRSYGPDRESGIPGQALDIEAYAGQPLASSPFSDFLYDPSNGIDSGGDIIEVGGSAPSPVLQ